MEKTNQLAIEQLASKYKDCNLLMPTSSEIQLNPFYKYTIMEVKVDTKEGSGDIFKTGTVKKGDRWVDTYSPAKPLLMKLASAAGIQFDPNNTYGEYLSKNCYRAKAYGAMRLPDGTGKTHCDEKVINLDDEEDRFRLEFMDKSLQGIKDPKQAEEAAKLFQGEWIETVDKWNKPCKAYVIADIDRDKYIDRSVLVNMTLLRKTFAEKAMTGAILRVVRALTGIKGSYTLAELQKPFAIPRVTFNPDYSDPVVRSAMLQQGLGSVSNMFGGSGSMPILSASPNTTMERDVFNPDDYIDNAAFASDTDFVDVSEETAPQTCQQQVTQDTDEKHCAVCGKKITESIYNFSIKNYGKPLCFNCQKEVQQ